MRKVLKLAGLCCANCAMKMEAQIGKLPGVSSATISFMTQRLVIEAAEDRFPAIVDEAQAIVSKIEPDCNIVR